nr:dioxygenase [Microbacterium immunditiarum]
MYQARQKFHEGRTRRRTRDNLIAGIVGGILILAVVGGQIAYFTLGPGAPEPAPSLTPTQTPTEAPPTPTPTPTDSVEPTPEPTATS